MNRIAVITTTRAEYGLLYPIVKELRKYEDDAFAVDLIVSGTHLSEKYGMTINEIKDSGTRIDFEIEIPLLSAGARDISYNQSVVLVKFTDLFEKEKYNAVVLLGDRYETLAVAIAAGNTRTPIFHLCGGDTTEGAIDEWIRHSITKMSYLHFVTNNDSMRRVIQLGEDPDRVFNYGSTSIDNVLKIANMTKAEALSSIGLHECKYVIGTYHPVTLEENNVDEQINSFLKALSKYEDIQFILTKSNADQGGARINELLDAANENFRNIHVFSSLGSQRYLSLMKYAEFVIGNSSSGIIETPAFHIPTINIGDRQKGRLQTESIINCGETFEEICEAIKKATDYEFRAVCKNCHNPYGDGQAAEHIAKQIAKTVRINKIDLKKKFYEEQV